MPCESCGVQFSMFRRKRACSECERLYCAACLRRGGGMCAPCRVLSTRPLHRHAIAHLKVRDLQCFLHRQNVSTRGCVEKEELVTLCVMHVNSVSYRRSGPRGASAFSSLKGLTTNINDFLNSAFDIRSPATAPAQQQTQNGPAERSGCYNTAHAHATSGGCEHPASHRERFTTTPGGERDFRVPPPTPPANPERSGDATSPLDEPRVDSADCFEIEDVDEAGWEFVTRPADPLPNDSELLMASPENVSPESADSQHVMLVSEQMSNETQLGIPADGRTTNETRNEIPAESQTRLRVDPDRLGGTPRRAASELELRRPGQADQEDNTSLQDEPMMDHPPPNTGTTESPHLITLDSMKSIAELDLLNVKQLKRLLARNRVEFRGCLERGELLARARTLYKDHDKYKGEVDNLPIEECCKICMAAPLECVLLECGHIAACTGCAKQLAECPICRQYVVRAVRCFKS